jgi:hypothetical protein
MLLAAGRFQTERGYSTDVLDEDGRPLDGRDR